MNKNLSGINQPKRVSVYDKNHSYIISFTSLRACARNLKISTTTLHRAIHSGNNLRGFYYKYE